MGEERSAELAELLKEVRRIEVQSNRLVTEVMAGGYSSVFHGAGIEFDEIREYAEGDDPRSIDWNVTARVGRPFVKEYVEERELRVIFLLDLSPSMSAGFGRLSARDMAARICACLALSAVKNDDKVGLIAFGEKIEEFVSPKKSLGHVLRIIRDCLALPASKGGSDLRPALEFAGRALHRRATVFLVSDFLSSGWRDSVTRSARHHDLIAVRMLPPELDPPKSGLMRLHDPETGEEMVVDWGSKKLREAYLERVRDWRQKTELALRRAEVDRIDVPIPLEEDQGAIARPILRFFRMRERRGMKR